MIEILSKALKLVKFLLFLEIVIAIASLLEMALIRVLQEEQNMLGKIE